MFSKSAVVSLFFLLSLSLLEAKSLLYKVSSESSTVYILGSIHLAKQELYPLDKTIRQAYNDSDVLVVELDAESQESARVMQKTMVQLGMYQNGKSLKTELTPETYTQLQAYTAKAGVSLQTLEQMRPWVVTLQLSVMEMMRLGYLPELGIDKHFIERAKRDKKSILALESIEEQMALLSRDDKAYQDKLLRYTLESMGEMEPMLNTLFVSWKNGDAQAIEKMFLLSMQDDVNLNEVYEALITERNHKMTKKIEAYLKTDKDYFVVVGAGHVVGKEGIVDLLEKRGYRLSQK
ncbi:MAG: TraB/GumN family protein [Campylobacterota bacterium]